MKRNRGWLRRAVHLLGCAQLFTALAIAQSSSPPIAYTVSLTSPEQHLLQVQIVLPPGVPQRELQLPVWNALYQVRDFSQYINWIHAKTRLLLRSRRTQDADEDVGCVHSCRQLRLHGLRVLREILVIVAVCDYERA